MTRAPGFIVFLAALVLGAVTAVWLLAGRTGLAVLAVLVLAARLAPLLNRRADDGPAE